MNMNGEITMLSIIICSRKADIPQELKDNIAATIGCAYELCVIDNSHNEFNIFTAYNEGVRRAKGDILCFMHEDIKYITHNWGNIVYSNFESDPSIGCVGVVGTHLLTRTPSGWYHSMLNSGGCIQVLKGGKENQQDLTHFKEQSLIEGVAIDGMWFCIPREVLKQYQIHFDSNTFQGFHCYDIDICLQIRNIGKKVMILSQVLIEHASYGSFSQEWCEATQLLFEKWQNKLPQNAGIIVSNEEILIRTQMVKQVMVWLTSYAQLEAEKNKILSSHAYRLGKYILKPFHQFK